ncbi:MAG: histidinol-phosphate transaminase [Planctomycetaceae bacterium]|nr:histidinol-phosphate transaminase [Planctomycetaceae bacterium]
MGYFRPTIEQMSGYTPGFQPKSPDVVKLNTNENPWPASPKVLETIKGLMAENLRRYPDPAGDAFRTAAAEVLGVKTENIICTNGGDDLLNICVRAFCDAERALAFAQPTYSLYPVLAKMQECPCVEIARNGAGSLDELAEADAALTIVCNPNAPTTDFLSIQVLGQLARRLSGVLLIDEAYVDFTPDNAIRLTRQFDNVIVLRSMSKGYSLAGIRFGFGIASPGLIEGLMKVRDSYPVDAVAIAAATAAISDQAHFKANVEKVKSERMRLTASLRLLGFNVGESQTNFILAQHSNAEAIYTGLIKNNIYVRYFKLPGLHDKLRITVGTPQQNDQLLAALKNILDIRQGKI